MTHGYGLASVGSKSARRPISNSRPFGEGMSWVYSYMKGKDFELTTSKYFILLIVAALKTRVRVWHGKTCAPKKV